MLVLLVSVYVTSLPLAVGALVSTIVVQLRLFRRLRAPIDNGMACWDGKRLLGDNKTWLGLAGLIIFTAISMCAWGLVCSANVGLAEHNWFYRMHANTIDYNIMVGALMGLVYALAELPNSFMKRRQGIGAGKRIRGYRGLPNVIIDNVDSVLGCALVMLFLCPLSTGELIALVVVSVVTHILANMMLVVVKVKKTI